MSNILNILYAFRRQNKNNFRSNSNEKKTGVILCQRKVPLNLSYKLSFKKNFQAYSMNAQRNHNAKVSLKGHNI